MEIEMKITTKLFLAFTCFGSFSFAANLSYQDLRLSSELSALVYCQNEHGPECRDSFVINNATLPINWYLGREVKANIRIKATKNLAVNHYSQGGEFWQNLHQLSTKTTRLNSEADSFQSLTIYDGKTNTVYISLRGSNNLVNWLLNLTVTPETFASDPTIKVHSGFNHFLKSVLASRMQNSSLTLQEWLEQIELAHKPSYVLTGHSLGAAGALLLSAKLIDNKIPANRVKLITYGQPAVGYWGFVSKYQPLITNYIRVVNIGNPDKIFGYFSPSSVGDPVVSSINVFNYQHFGTALVIAIDKNHGIDESLPPSLPDSFKYQISIHDRYNYRDFIWVCDVFSQNCPTVVRAN